jgi:hypothetical protein
MKGTSGVEGGEARLEVSEGEKVLELKEGWGSVGDQGDEMDAGGCCSGSSSEISIGEGVGGMMLERVL